MAVLCCQPSSRAFGVQGRTPATCLHVKVVSTLAKHCSSCQTTCYGFANFHQQRLSSRRTRASSNDEESTSSSSASAGGSDRQALSSTAEGVVELLMQDFMGELMSLVPDAAIDHLIEARKQAGISPASSNITANDVVSLVTQQHHAAAAMQFALDSYSHRLLVHQKPARFTPLSVMRITADKSVHRCLVVSERGEQVVLTVVLEKQDSLQAQYRSSPRIEQAWRVRSIAGETAAEEALPAGPSPSVGPELVVQAQLHALRHHDPAAVFEFASPQNQAVTGPVERFAALLQSPQFKPLLGHLDTHSLQRHMASPHKYFEVVVVRSANTGFAERTVNMVYLWHVAQQQPGSELAGAWVTQSVQLVSAANTLIWPGAVDGEGGSNSSSSGGKGGRR